MVEDREEHMAARVIYITESDFERLEQLLTVAGEPRYPDRADLTQLEEELDRAHIVDSKEIPPSVVTMNSQVKVQDLDTNEHMLFTLVFPKDANIDAGKLSVLSPIGTAILGYSAGDTIEWPVPGGTRRIKIEQILYQPEAAGDYHL